MITSYGLHPWIYTGDINWDVLVSLRAADSHNFVAHDVNSLFSLGLWIVRHVNIQYGLFIFVPYFTLKVLRLVWLTCQRLLPIWACRRSEFFRPVHSGILAPPCGALVLWVKAIKIDPPSKVLCTKPITSKNNFKKIKRVDKWRKDNVHFLKKSYSDGLLT